MAAQLNIIRGNCDDISIAQGLMGGPKIPQRKYSFTRITYQQVDTPQTCDTYHDTPQSRNTHQQIDTSQNRTDSSDFIGNEWSRQELQSSNTWTSSSGDAMSDHVDIDDRSEYVLEYNRVAQKVSFNSADVGACLTSRQYGMGDFPSDSYEAENVR